MAGCIVWRCQTCNRNASERFCNHPTAAYSVVYYVSGKPKWKKVGRDKKDALAVLSKIHSELVMGTYFDLKPIRFGELAERFLTTYGQVAYKPASREYYRFRVKALLPTFGELYLTDITREKIGQYAADQLTQEKVSPATINKNIGTLKRVLNLAVDWGYLPKNPVQGIKSLREEHKEKDFLTPEEIRLLLKHSDEPYRTLFMTAVLTGMRRGEVLGLLWGDIDWNSNVIHVRHNLSYFQGKDGRRTWRLISPKSTKSIRAVPMPQELREALEIYRLSAPVSPHDLVFCYKDGEPLHPDWIIKSEFHPALVRAGLRRIRFHDLRHTYAAILITHAVNIKVIQTLLGHVSIETTLDTYGHLLPGAANEVGAKMSEVVFGQSPTEKQPISR